MNERLYNPATINEEDAGEDSSLRPRRLSGLIGRDFEKKTFGILLEAAKKRKEPIDHVLLYGPPGLGKTTMAHILANEMAAKMRVTSGPAIARAGDLAAILSGLDEGDFLFIDEIHRLNKTIEEILYPAMEDYSLDVVIGKGPSARTVKVELPKFTLVGATTKIGMLSSPLRDRFGVVHRLDFYSEEDLSGIASRTARILGIEMENDALDVIASRSRGTARIANRILKRVRDYAEIKSGGKANVDVVKKTLDLLKIDEYGLDAIDRKVIGAIIEYFDGGPAGLKAVSSMIAEDPNTVMEVCEPYLLKEGFIMRTPRGRVVTAKGYSALNLNMPKE